MSDLMPVSAPVSALGGVTFDGFAKLREVGPWGMISLRAKPGTKGLDKAIRAAVGTALPAQRRMEWAGSAEAGRGCGWMSPDEYLLILPYADVQAAMAGLDSALKGEDVLLADVSDARSVFRIEGDKAAQVLAKLMPVDFAALAPGELRRSRAAQVAAAVWAGEGGYTLVAFRSVGAYVMGLLTHSAQPGSELD